MNELMNALLTQAVGAACVAMLLRALQRRVRERPLFRIWAAAWAAHTAFLLVSAASLALGPAPTPVKRVCQLVSLSVSLLSSAGLVIGAQDMLGRSRATVMRLARLLVPGVLVVALAAFALSLLPGLSPMGGSAVRQLPRLLASTLALAYVVATCLRPDIRSLGVGYRVVGVACLLWACSQALYVLSSIDALGADFGFGRPFALVEPFIRVQLSFFDLVWLGGIAVGVVWLLLEEYQRSAAALAETTVAYRALIETSPTAIVAFDQARQVTVWNAEAERLLGWSAAEAVGHPLPTVAAGEDRWHQLLSGTEIGRTEVSLPRKDGSMVVALVRGATLRNAAGAVTGGVVLASDNTDVRRLEEQVRHSQKMEAIGQLAGGIAHDFNNLLTAMLGAVHLLKDDLGPDHPAMREADEIHESATRAADLTRRLLAFGRRQISQRRILSVNVVVEDLDRLLRRLIGQEVSLVLALGEDPGPVFADRGELEQVITNLCVNALDATPRGGRITIATHMVHAEAPLDGLLAAVQGHLVQLDVRDTGSGMEPDVLSRIFEPYFTTKPVGKGTGLGLATVYALVERMSGQLRVHSSPGSGTTVSVYLPVVRDPIAVLT